MIFLLFYFSVKNERWSGLEEEERAGELSFGEFQDGLEFNITCIKIKQSDARFILPVYDRVISFNFIPL